MRLFISPTYGPLELEQVVQRMCAFMKKEGEYRIIVGTDSQPLMRSTLFVSAIVVHRIGRGGIYFYRKTYDLKPYSTKERILARHLWLGSCEQILQLLAREYCAQ